MIKLKRARVKLYTFCLILLNLSNFSFGEIIDNRKLENKKFDVWSVSCEDDEMLSEIRCRLFVEITNGTTIFVNPYSKGNKLLFVSHDSHYGTKAYVKVDENQLVSSEIFSQNKYNFIKFSQNIIDDLYNKLQTGKVFYMRFTIRDTLSPNGFKEITVKISLDKFINALSYFVKQRGKYDNNK